MKHIIITAIFISIFSSPPPVLTQTTRENATLPLAVSIRTDQSTYTWNDSIQMTILIKNISTQPLFLYGELRWGLSASLFLFVSNEKGQFAQMNYLEDALPPSPPFKRASFIKLNPGYLFGTTRSDKLSDLVPGPGTYHLQVEYHSPIPSRFSPGLPIWSSEKPPVSSMMITLKCDEKGCTL